MHGEEYKWSNDFPHWNEWGFPMIILKTEEKVILSFPLDVIRVRWMFQNHNIEHKPFQLFPSERHWRTIMRIIRIPELDSEFNLVVFNWICSLCRYTICVDLDHGEPEHHAEICVGDDEEDDSIHSGELSHSPCLDTGEADVVESSGSNGHLQSQWTEDARNPQLHSSPHMLGSGGAGHHPSNSDTSVLASSRHPSNYNRYHEVVPIQHLHPYHHQQLHFSGQGPPGPHPVQYFHHTQLYAPSGTPSSNAGKFQGHKPGSLGSSPNSVSSSSPALVLSNSSSPSSNHVQKQQSLPRQMSDAETEVIRKRLYRVGLNLFNKKPEAGILYLVKKKFLEGTSPSVARFLISRKGLSKQMIGEYLANLQSPFSLACLEHFASEIDLSTLPIDLSLRRFQSFLRMPGEAQKIERIMETFSRRYAVCNPHVV